MSASGHRGNDADLVAVFHGSTEIIEVADIFIVDIDVDKAADLAVVEQPLGDARKLLAHVVENRLHRAADRFDDGQAIGVLPHGGGNMNAYGHVASFNIHPTLTL